MDALPLFAGTSVYRAREGLPSPCSDPERRTEAGVDAG
jgi:hypothetical protein